MTSRNLNRSYSLIVSKLSLDQIVQFEVSSEAYYKKALSHPIWPGAESGVTIGIGYDLGYHSGSSVRSDWEGKISDSDLNDLLEVVGLKKEAAKNSIRGIKHVTVPFESAKEVFYVATIPKYAKAALSAYPGIDMLPADAQGALLSLVFNRGSRMSGSSRAEMKAIQQLVIGGDLSGISDQILSMKRLWDINKLPGLHKRRDIEADLVANARTSYDTDELMHV